jgi:hypothetical protein
MRGTTRPANTRIARNDQSEPPVRATNAVGDPALNSLDEREVLVAPDSLGTLEDDQLMMEIELVTELMIAGSGSPSALDPATIDAILGVRRPGGAPAPGAYLPSRSYAA